MIVLQKSVRKKDGKAFKNPKIAIEEDSGKWQQDVLKKVIEEQRTEDAKKEERSWIFYEYWKTVF